MSTVTTIQPSQIQDTKLTSSSINENEDIYTINDLLIQRATQLPDISLLAYPATEKGTDDYEGFTARDLDRFADEGTRAYIGLGVEILKHHEQKVIALLAPTSLDYITSIFTLTRLGYSILLLSPRLATEAYLSLLEKTNCTQIIHSSNFIPTITSLKTQRPEIQSFTLLPRSKYDIPIPSGPYFKSKTDGKWANDKIAFIIHSSGSTGLPKPIFQTHNAALTNYSSGLGYRAFLTLPLYHNHGLSTFFRAIYSGNEIALFNANLPLTGPNLIAAMEKLRPGGFHGVPYALKLLGESGRGIELLRNCEIVMFGGSSCPDELGDKLVDAGVYLVSHYGATEIGQLMISFRPRETDKAWNYVRCIPGKEKFMKFDPQGPDSYELVVLDGLPSKVASNSDDPPNSFRTSDLFKPHPTIPNAWKYLGRLDDRITLVNGEKVLPVPFEHQVRSNDFVQECWMFGIGCTLPGIMIVPAENTKDLSKGEVFERIWPSIQLANERVEGFSQVSKEMVEILPVGTEFPCTDKGTMIRAKTYRKFKVEIDAVYKRFEEGSLEDGVDRKALSIPELETFLLDAFKNKIGIQELDADTDLFSAGVDSLQAITIWGLIRRELDLGTGSVGQNIVFEYPSIRRLASLLYSLRTGEDVEVKDEIQLMAELIEKYSYLPQHIPGNSVVEKESIILTGATGSLGAHILSQLAAKEQVEKIYCLVRASSPSNATERVLSSLSTRLLPPVSSPKLVCLPADLSKPNLGLSPTILTTLRSTLTKIIHCAWAVNFNLGVSSFESHHIKGTYNLLSLCLSTTTAQPASLYFCSSVSAAAGTPLPALIPETYLTNLHHAQNMGYARSKLVTELMLKNAAEKTRMKVGVLRSGQIVGDVDNGVWNDSEAIPLMIRSAVTIGALPELDENPSWFPVNLVAKSFLDISVHHIQNTHIFSWTHSLLPALHASGLPFKPVPINQWLQLLKHSNPDPILNPTIKLLDFFEEKYEDGKPARKGLVFETRETERESETVREGFDVVGSGLVGRMVERWAGDWGLKV